MGVGSQPGLMHSMSAAEHKRSAEKNAADAAQYEREAERYDAEDNPRAAHTARLNTAKATAISQAHREMMGRQYLMGVGSQ